MDYCDVFISCLDSNSDGTHSLLRIHWWASDAMLHFFKSDEETNSSTSWMTWVRVEFQHMRRTDLRRNGWRLPPHAVQSSHKVIFIELVLVPQQRALLQRHWHGRPVFGTFTAGEADTIHPSTDLRRHVTDGNISMVVYILATFNKTVITLLKLMMYEIKISFISWP